jgi:superfamily II DNA or RNA helicase
LPTHDIVDNRHQILVDHINRILSSTESARFAVGYFFLSGLQSIAKRIDGVKEVKLLIGNTTNRETLEQMAEGYRRLDLLANAAEEQKYPKAVEKRQMVAAAAANLRVAAEQMDQTDDAEALVHCLVKMIEEGRLKVRVYTKGRMHAKAYIFDYGDVFDLFGKQVDREENGIAIVGSSNLTLSGVTSNTELNVVVHGNDNHTELGNWFDELWKESEDFDAALMEEMKASWAAAAATPYDIYMKTLYALVRERLEGEDSREILWDDDITSSLADFQKVAVRQAIQMIRDYNGAFVADVVGLGKSFIGAAIVKHFERTERAKPLIVCPAPLVGMWERYNEVYDLNARVLSMGYLTENADLPDILTDVKYRDRDFVLIDESHNFRHSDTQRYRLMEKYLATGKRCCFLTATPRNKGVMDVYHQIKLFHQDDKTDIPISPPNLVEFFKLIEKGEKHLPDLLANILVRRTRDHILRWYGYDADTQKRLDPSRYKEYLDGKKRAYVVVGGRHNFFPRRQLQTISYSIEDTYQGLYQDLRRHLGKPRKSQPKTPPEHELTYARYGLWHYVKPSLQETDPYKSLHRAGHNLCGLVRILLFKRFESSVYAFRETIRRLLKMHEAFLMALDEGLVPAGDAAQTLLYEADQYEEAAYLDALREVSGRYDIGDFDVPRLRRCIVHDIKLLQHIETMVAPITADKDAKLQTLKAGLGTARFNEGKVLIFTQFSDTAQYLYENLNPGGNRADVDVIFSGNKDKGRIVGRFAPKANPDQAAKPEINTLIATDVLSEGLNLQDADKIINYDLHWNPVRLIQRFGRIDRIGSENDVVYGYNFLPETGIEKELGLKAKLSRRIQEIHDTIGEDAAILENTEKLNESAMYAIYEQKSDQLPLFDDEDEFLDINEAEEIMRLLKGEDPTEFDRIANLRDGIRSARASSHLGIYVFCEAGRYQQLFLVDNDGNVTSKDIPRVLGTLRCQKGEPGLPLPAGHNAAVMRVKAIFDEEVRHRQGENRHSLSLTLGQRYVIRELRTAFSGTEDPDQRARINLLEEAFRGPITTAVKRELNLLRRNGVTAEGLLANLKELYSQHELGNRNVRTAREAETVVPRIVCSEALV